MPGSSSSARSAQRVECLLKYLEMAYQVLCRTAASVFFAQLLHRAAVVSQPCAMKHSQPRLGQRPKETCGAFTIHATAQYTGPCRATLARVSRAALLLATQGWRQQSGQARTLMIALPGFMCSTHICANRNLVYAHGASAAMC